MIAFAEFFRAVHGAEPYPWQEALADRLATGALPRAIVVPTGCGKTATIDALVYALASQAERPPAERSVGVRLVWAIDRRILVDEVHDHATKLAERLTTAEDGVLYEVATSLRSLTDGGEPLVATRWRGGLARERTAYHPFQPEVITSTVAQIGSRLLFRGYGVGERSLALAAGLAGTDTTICLDEAHLAGPFRETVTAVRRLRAAEPFSLPTLGLITLTATPDDSEPADERIELNDADRERLRERLEGVKTASLVELASPKDRDRRAALADAVADHVDAGRRVVACVVNTVRMAVDVAADLERRLREADHLLLIGPQRPADRRQGVEKYRSVLFKGGEPLRPLIVVATQTFEVGLDADVEALVTESASAAAIVQRLGRLNRSGRREGVATIVRDREALPLYRGEERIAWEWLSGMRGADGRIDVSVQALLDAASERPAAITRATAPDLDRAVVDRLVQTSPRPARADDPDIDAFLNGVEVDPAADVHVAWRCDLRPTTTDETYRRALLTLAPPHPDELVTIGIGRARALMASIIGASAAIGSRVLDEPDVEGGRGEAGIPDVAARTPLTWCIVRGRDVLAGSSGLRPGDTLVIPGDAGGYRTALAPGSRDTVSDVAPDVTATAPLRFFRLSDEVLRVRGIKAFDRRRLLLHARKIAREGSEVAPLVGALGLEVEQGARVDLRAVLTRADLFAGDFDDDEQPVEDDAGAGADATERESIDDVFVITFRPVPEELRARDSRVPLANHAVEVRRRLDKFIAKAELPTPIPQTLSLAALMHDHGKADPRVQAFFHGGQAGIGDELLAKSTFGTRDLRADRAARAAAGLPKHLRHEVESVTVALDALGTLTDVDVPLWLYLIGTHHGLGRPIPLLPEGGVPARRYLVDVAGVRGVGTGDGEPATRDGAWLTRFLDVVSRYGAWGSAYLAALLMLADRQVSAEGN